MSLVSDMQNEKHEMEMTPMIDVTFLLLIFFMCTLKFKMLEGKLTAYLPKDAGVNPEDTPPIEKVQVDIHVIDEGTKMTADGKNLYTDPTGKARHSFANRRLSYTLMNQKFTDLGELQKVLKRIKDQRGEDKAPAVLQPFGGTIMGDIIPVLDAAVAAGFEDISFGGAFPDHVR
ncbi:MAG: biopolymer transporter ExbD [Planctomycetota bacterium]